MARPTKSPVPAHAWPTDVVFEPAVHRDKAVILIRFPYNAELIARVKRLTGARWSSSHKAWHVPDNNVHRACFGLPAAAARNETQAQLSPANASALQRFVDTLRLKGYSPNTERTYRNEFAQLLRTLGPVPVDTMTPEQLRSYMLHCTNDLHLSEATLHSRLNAIKFHIEQVLHKEKFFAEIPRPKKPHNLPKHISQQEVKRLFDHTPNLKHNTMLRLCYGMGLRVSELVSLKVKDIDSANMQAHIRRAKGKKDRYVTLPASILEQLRAYFRAYRPKDFLFEGQDGGAYSTRSAQIVFKQALKRAGINKDVGIHGLRHSYATHLLEAGTDIGFIQKLLGHEHIETTLLYAQVTNRNLKQIKSPLDNL